MNFKHAFFTIIFIFQFILTTQSQVSGTVLSEDKTPINKVQIYNSNGGIITETDIKGYFEFSIKKEELKVFFYSENFKIKEFDIPKNNSLNLQIILNDYLLKLQILL